MKRIKVAIDCCTSERYPAMIECLYGDQGYEFILVEKLVPPRTADEHWADVFKRFGGEVVLSGDPNIGHRPHQAAAFIANEFISFFFAPPWQNMPGHVQAAAVIYWWPAIDAKIRDGEKGRNWRIPCVGRGREIRLAPVELEPMLLPPEVLHEALAFRASTGAMIRRDGKAGGGGLG